MKASTTIIAVVLLALATAWASLFVIDEREVAIVTQFGVWKRSIEAPGLYVKLPFIQSVNRMERRILSSDVAPSSYLTRDKKRLVVDPITRWRVSDPLQFYTSVRDQVGARSRLDDIINSELRRELASHDFGEVVCVPDQPGRDDPRVTDSIAGGPVPAGSAAPAPSAAPPVASSAAPLASGVPPSIPPVPPSAPPPEVAPPKPPVMGLPECGREAVMLRVTQAVRGQAEKYGILVIDVRMKRADLPPEVQESVFQRMKAERSRVAKAYRSEGEEEAQKIRADADKQQRLYLAEAYEQAQKLKGAGDAESIRISAGAYEKDPEFYAFVRSLETYEASVGGDSTVVLTTGSDLFRYLESPGTSP